MTDTSDKPLTTQPILPASPLLYQRAMDAHRRTFFIDNPPPGTTQHAVMHPDFWKRHRDHLQRNDIVHVLCEGDDGEKQRWEVCLNVEAAKPNVIVSLRQRFDRKPLAVDAVPLPDGYSIRWCAGGDGQHKAFTVFDGKGQPGPVTGHATVESARSEWLRGRPQAA